MPSVKYCFGGFAGFSLDDGHFYLEFNKNNTINSKKQVVPATTNPELKKKRKVQN